MQVTTSILVKLLEVDRYVDGTSILLTVFGLRQQMGLFCSCYCVLGQKKVSIFLSGAGKVSKLGNKRSGCVEKHGGHNRVQRGPSLLQQVNTHTYANTL